MIASGCVAEYLNYYTNFFAIACSSTVMFSVTSIFGSTAHVYYRNVPTTFWTVLDAARESAGGSSFSAPFGVPWCHS